MTTNDKTVRIFIMPQQFPCGPQSSCCGPIGQTEEEIQAIKTTIESELGCRVEVLNVMKRRAKLEADKATMEKLAV